LPRHVDSSALVVLGRRQDATDEIPLEMDETPTPIDVAPLEGQELACAHPCAETAQRPRVPLRKMFTRDRENVDDLISGERELRCVVVYLPSGIDVRSFEGSDFRRTQLVRDAIEAQPWKRKLLERDWIQE
jgi:hypothetical protein